MFLLNGKPLALDVPFETPNGTQYPANWLRLASPEDRKDIGFTEVPDPPSPWKSTGLLVEYCAYTAHCNSLEIPDSSNILSRPAH